jgi:hypothetical protein
MGMGEEAGISPQNVMRKKKTKTNIPYINTKN